MTPAPRGLATLALLTARFDEGRDHLALFEPFVADAVLACSLDNFVAADIRGIVEDRSGLVVPSDALNTILGRFVKRSLLRRDGGRFLRTLATSQLLDREGFNAARRVAEERQAELADAFLAFAADAGLSLANREEALVTLCTFVAENKVPLVLEEPLPESPLDRTSLSKRLLRLTARFIAERCMSSEHLAPSLQALVEGIVIRDAVLLSDFADLGQKLTGLTVFLDTPILFAALDLAGVANGIATREGLSLIREAGASTAAFDATIAEMRRILILVEGRLATAEGRLSLYPTDLVRHIRSARLMPADIRTISATLEARLSNISIAVRETPPRDARYTLDEKALAEALQDRYERDADTPRIRHDVDCVAAVLTRRAGRTASSIERSRSVFCTTSGRVIRNVQQWYFGQGETGVPPIVHQFALSSVAWLKRPKASTQLKVHELIAVCGAALKPSRVTWDRFTQRLKQLRQDGVLTDDETVAIVASELTEPLLSQIDDDLGEDAGSIEEAIDRVRDSYRQNADRAAATAIGAAQAEAALAQREAKDAVTERDAVLEGLERRARGIGRLVGMIFMGVMTLLLVPAAVLSVPGVFEEVGGTVKVIARTLIGLSAAYGLYSQLHGPSVAEHRRRLELRVAQIVGERLLGLPTAHLELARISDGQNEAAHGASKDSG